MRLHRPQARATRPGAPRRRLAYSALLLVMGCAGGGDFLESTPSEVLRVGILADRPPLAYREGDGWTGLEIDLARLAADDLGMHAEFVELRRGGLLPSLESGDVDLITSPLSVRTHLPGKILFTQPFLQVNLQVAIRAAGLAAFENPAEMEKPGARVGFVTNSPGGDYVRDQLPQSAAYAFEDSDGAIRSLRSHRIDFFVHDGPEMLYHAARYQPSSLIVLPRILGEENFAWAVNARNTNLADALNGFLDEAMAGRNLEIVLDAWLSKRPQPVE